MNYNVNRTGWFVVMCLVAVAAGAVGVGAIFHGSGSGNETSKKPQLTPAASQTRKPVRAMNFALGPMVFFARELDFAVKNSKGDPLDDNRIAARVESQMQGLRQLYRREIDKNPELVGSLILQINIDFSGQVHQVKEIKARLDDAEFRQIVADETRKWTFADVVSQPLTVQVPLLFVEEGMDITTLLRWESALRAAQGKVVPVAAAQLEKTARGKTAASVKSKAAEGKRAPVTVKNEDEQGRIKYAAALRKAPNFSAPVLTTFTIGTKVTVLNRSNDWLEVRSRTDGPSGYLRKEFVTPIDVVVKR